MFMVTSQLSKGAVLCYSICWIERQPKYSFYYNPSEHAPWFIIALYKRVLSSLKIATKLKNRVTPFSSHPPNISVVFIQYKVPRWSRVHEGLQESQWNWDKTIICSSSAHRLHGVAGMSCRKERCTVVIKCCKITRDHLRLRLAGPQVQFCLMMQWNILDSEVLNWAGLLLSRSPSYS